MNRTIVLWGAVAVFLAGIVAVVYVNSQPDTAASARSSERPRFPNPWLDMANTTGQTMSKADREHEMAGLKVQLKKAPNHVPVLLRMAEVARGMGNTTESIDYLTQAVAGDAGNIEARLELGRELFEAGNVDKAIAVTKEILDRKPTNADALYNLGAIYGNLGQDALARQYFQKALDSDPGSTSGLKAKQGLATLSASR